MSDTLSIREQLQEASFNLESYAFHRRYPGQPGPRDGAQGFVRMQSKNYQRGIELFDNIIRQTPVTWVIGDTPLTIHDPLLWPYEYIDDFWDNYDDDLDAAGDFYRPVVSLLPHTELVIDTCTELIGPGDAVSYPYLGNTALKRLIRVEELADSLIDGGHIAI